MTRTQWILAGVAASAAIALPFAFGPASYVMSLIVASMTIACIAVAWALLGNLGGLVSFGHAAFFGVGAYASALLAMKLGWPVPLAMLGGSAAAAVSALLTLPALRLHGPYFALAMLAYAHIFRILTVEFDGVTGGAGGLLRIPTFPKVFGFDLASKAGTYWIVLAMVVAFCLIYGAIRRSTVGLALRAMHDSELATRVVGVPSTHLKALMLVLSAAMTGLIGAFNAHQINFLEPDYAFSSNWTVLPIAAAIFGGYRTVWGPALGAVAVYLLDQLFFKEWMPQGHQIVFGILLGAMILLSPRGLLPLILARLPGSAPSRT